MGGQDKFVPEDMANQLIDQGVYHKIPETGAFIDQVPQALVDTTRGLGKRVRYPVPPVVNILLRRPAMFLFAIIEWFMDEPLMVCNTMWMLSDFTAANGATELVPGSHLTGAHPNQADQSGYDIVQPEAPAGSLMVFDGRLWHGTGANSSNTDRMGVLVTFCAPQFRQQENQTLALDPALWDKIPGKLKERLGFKVWNAYGRIESSAASMVSPNPPRIGELKPGAAKEEK